MDTPASSSVVARMSGAQFLVILICFACNMLDGMDVLIISYTAPAIAKAWEISPAALGVVFSSGLIGMTVGAILIAPLADRYGRKPMMIVAAMTMGVFIYATSFVSSIFMLIVCRFASGLGIGTMMASTASLSAENAPLRTRDFWVSLVVAGYPVGAVITGLFSAQLIEQFGWGRLFEFSGTITLLILPVIHFLLKESQEFKLHARPKDARVAALLTPEMKWGTLHLWGALFLAFATVYFLINWIPKLASNSGLSTERAIYAGTVFNLGAVVGIPVQGYLSSRFGLKKTIGSILMFTSLLLVTFRFFITSDLILIILFLLGFAVQGGFVGLYAVAARMYPTTYRTTGVGWAIGVGRLGGIFGPIAGGFLVALGLGMTDSFAVFALPTILAGVITYKISSAAIS
jgi:AAHS family 4-hydroxybenzoate transporter-like MFS transporter